jgi:uncharacterized protein YciI
MRRTWIMVGLIALAGCASSGDAPQTQPAAPPTQARTESPPLAAETSPAAGAAEEVHRPPETLFAVRFLPGPKWVAGKGPMEQPGIGAHAANMAALQERRVLWCGGPFLDGAGGLAVFRAASLAEAKQVASEDPAVTSGLLVPEVHPWLLVMTPED